MGSGSILACLRKHPSTPSTLALTRYSQRLSPFNWHKACVGSDRRQALPAPCPAMGELHILHVCISRRPTIQIHSRLFPEGEGSDPQGWQMGRRHAAELSSPSQPSVLRSFPCTGTAEVSGTRGKLGDQSGALLVTSSNMPREPCSIIPGERAEGPEGRDIPG